VTTVPFKPTQGRPVLCRQCFKSKRAPNTATPETVTATSELVAAASSADAAVEQAQVSAQVSAELSAAAQPSQA